VCHSWSYGATAVSTQRHGGLSRTVLVLTTVWPPCSADAVCPRPPLTLIFGRLTLKLVCKSHKMGNLPSKFRHARPLGSRIIRYVRDGRTDRRTDKSNTYCPHPYRRDIIIWRRWRRERVIVSKYTFKSSKVKSSQVASNAVCQEHTVTVKCKWAYKAVKTHKTLKIVQNTQSII